MPSFFHEPLSRRFVLRAAGAALALPLLEAMSSRAVASPSTFRPWAKSDAAHPRTIFCYIPNGVNIIDWVPKTTGSNYALSPTLVVLKEHRADFSVLSGLGHPNSQGGHTGADTWLTAANLKAKPGSDYSNSISADQILAEVHGKETRFPSLQISDMSGTGAAMHSHTLSFDRNGTPLPAENSPQRLFDRLFVPDTATDRRATLMRYAEQRSILDDIAAEASRLERKLGKADRQKLDEYLSSVRQTETQVRRLEGWVDIPKRKISTAGLQLVSRPCDVHDRSMWLDVMLELSYLSFITDTTRVITFEWSREANGFGANGENHHELSHHDGSPEKLAKLAGIDRFHVGRLARFMTMLKSTVEESSTMLDNTLIMFGSGMNSGVERGDHSPKNIPLLVAGGKNFGLKHNQHLAFNPDKHPPLSNVLLTLLQRAGTPADKFADATGTLTGLV
jgi:Protein of unknown function (DUF1552)